MDIFWNIFEKSGSIEAYLGYKETEKGNNYNKNDFYRNDNKDKKSTESTEF